VLVERVVLAFGNEAHTTAWHLKRALTRLGVEVFVDGPGHSGASAPPLTPLIWVESAQRWLPLALTDEPPSASVAWAIDTHRIGRWRKELPRAFGGVGFAQRTAAIDADTGQTGRGLAQWVPLAAPVDLARPDDDLRERPIDVAFVGQAPPGSRRAAILAALSQRLTVHRPTGHVTPAEMMEVYGRSKIVLNIPLAGELNMRVFEAAASRSALLCAPTDDLASILPLGGYHLVEAGDPQTWVDAALAALRSEEIQAGADSAYEAVLAAHTYDHRAKALLGLATASSAPRRERSRAMAMMLAELGERRSVRCLPLSSVERTAWGALAVGMGAARSALRRLPDRSPLSPGPRF
jgi:hypothetical protein